MFEVYRHTWEVRTRECAFSLDLEGPGGAAFADFGYSDDQHVTLTRISFDGYGCCTPQSADVAEMAEEDSVLLRAAVDADNLNTEPVRSLLSRFFDTNRYALWEDALVEHGLVVRRR